MDQPRPCRQVVLLLFVAFVLGCSAASSTRQPSAASPTPVPSTAVPISPTATTESPTTTPRAAVPTGAIQGVLVDALTAKRLETTVFVRSVTVKPDGSFTVPYGVHTPDMDCDIGRSGEFDCADLEPGSYILVILDSGGTGVAWSNEDGEPTVIAVEPGQTVKLKEVRIEY